MARRMLFTSRRRSWVRVETVKSFEEPMGVAVERRIGALKPGYYTRIGAAVRHAALPSSPVNPSVRSCCWC
ncbi:nitric oxide reductase activation protein [Bradyrhizobium sp. AZCC 1721]